MSLLDDLNDHLNQITLNVSLHSCPKWEPANQIFFQLANLGTFLGLLFVISSFSMLLFLRIMLILSNLLIILWSRFVTCQADTLFWNVLLIVVNIVHSLILLYKLHPFIRFPYEVEMIYRNMFAPIGMSRYQFNRLYRCSKGVQTIKSKDVYAAENETIVDCLSLLLSGRFSIHKNGVIKHLIDSSQFLESPEWFGMSGDSDRFQVTIVALEDSQLLVWNRDKLKLSISTDRYLQTILDHILCRDIVKKLMLSMDIETNNHNQSSSEKAKLIATNNYPLMNTSAPQDLSSYFWNLTSIGIKAPNFDVEAHETTL